MRIVIVGAGDLGLRLAAALAREPRVSEVVLLGRRARQLASQAFFAACCGPAAIRCEAVDALDSAAVQAILEKWSPDIVVQCASLLSPWALAARDDGPARALLHAGFGCQLPAQLPVLLSVMTAVARCPRPPRVINCSYPDVTNAISARLGNAPILGIGNVGMLAAAVRATLRMKGREALVRVLGHHAHVTPVLRADASLCPGEAPRVYLGEEGHRADELAFQGVPLDSNRDLNALTATHALEVIRALSVDAQPPLRTSAPGPNGLPGGYPVRITANRVELDLPPGVSLEEAASAQARYARMDGIEAIEEDGTVVFTEAVRAELAPGLAQPLRPHDALARFEVLRRYLASGRAC